MLQRAFDQRLERKENFAVIRERIARLSRDRDSAFRRPPRSSSSGKSIISDKPRGPSGKRARECSNNRITDEMRATD